MRFFWILLIITIITASLNLVFFISVEVLALLIIMDFIVLWSYTEIEKNGNEENVLLEKIENLERLTSDLFNKVTKKFSNTKNNKKDIVEWLNKF